MADIFLNSDPVLEMSLRLPMNGAWSAELQIASDAEPEVGSTAALALPGLELTGRVVRAGQFAERLRVRLTGGSIDWSEVQPVKHYRETGADQVLQDVGVMPETALATELSFWTRNPGTTGSAVEAIARHLGFNWRVNPGGTVRIAAEDPDTIEDPDAEEISRDPARGIVTMAPELATILPGTIFGNDLVGDVVYELGDAFRCRYYTEARGRLRGAFDRLVRFLTRDTLFLGQYTAEVVVQAADGTLDLLPDDERIRSQGLQAVPIRHGLPGVEVEVPAGERVLLAFDGGDPSKPYAALWHTGQVTAVRIGGDAALALALETKARLDALQAAHDSHIHITTATVGASPTPGVIAPTAAPVGSLADIATTKLFGN